MSNRSQSSVDPIDSLFDFGEMDTQSYQSPSLSPAATAKTPFVRPSSLVTTPTMPSQPQITGPSHPYDLYKQQTGLVPGALASTLAINQTHTSGYTNNYNLGGIMPGLSPDTDLFDFNTDPSQASLAGADIEMDFDSPGGDAFLFDTVNPTALGAGPDASPSLSSPSAMPSQASNVGRLYPGMHAQAALAKAQAQQRQQQNIIMQQRQQQQQQATKPRNKSTQVQDPLVEQKITQLLNSMRAKPMSGDGDDNMPMLNIPRPRKDEDDMDDDERLLASEEGKKLSSKERRQLRNKVSARAFRSRRKEYISQLEAEIANKVTENGELRAENHALADENQRLTDLTRMLLSSSAFSSFLDHLSANPAAMQQPQQQQQQQQSNVKTESRQEQQSQRNVPKDVNAYAAAQQLQQQRIGMAMIPEASMDFSMLSLDTDTNSFSYQPQVFAVLETPEMPAAIDTSMLSGKTSNFVGEQFSSDDEKVDMPVIQHPAAEKTLAPEQPAHVVDEEFENDPEFALYHDDKQESATVSLSPVADRDTLEPLEIFGGIESEKLLARYELVDASEEEKSALLTTARIQRLEASLESIASRLDQLCI